MGLHPDPGPLWGPMAMQPPRPVEIKKNSLTSSKYDGVHEAGPLRGLSTAIAAELMIGFWFRVGVVLAVKTLESLEYCIRRKC